MLGRIVGDERSKGVDQLGSHGRREARCNPHVLKAATVGVVEADQERTHPLAVFVHAVAGHDHIGGAGVFHLELDPLVGLVGAIEWLCDQTVETGTFEGDEPVEGEGAIARRRDQMDRGAERLADRFEDSAALAKRCTGEVGVVQRQEVEGDELGRRFGGETVDAGLGRMDALLQGVEPEMIADRDDDLAVDHASLGQAVLERSEQLREIAGERSFVP